MYFDLQKASMYKRISAFLFDIIMLGILVAGIGFVLSDTLDFDCYLSSMESYYDEYEKEYGVKFEITGEEYSAFSEDKKANYDEAYRALNSDEEVMRAYGIVVNLTLVIVSISILLGYLILEFFLPLFFKNGQTLGKKIFGIGVMHTSGIRITPVLLFIRTVLGKYTLETMVPLLIVMMIFFNAVGLTGTIILGLILLVQLILVITTKTNSFIHDILAKTVVVDMASQMIFDDGAALLAYKKELHAEEVSRSSY